MRGVGKLDPLAVAAVSLTGYHENVTEYGTHWNFFFTLAAVKVGSSVAGSFPTINFRYF